MNRHKKIKNIKSPNKEKEYIKLNPEKNIDRFFNLLFIFSVVVMILLSGVK